MRRLQFYLNGSLTLDENIADIVGIKEAYFAYRRYVDKHGKEPRLPGMEQYNPEQLFFLGYANVSIIIYDYYYEKKKNSSYTQYRSKKTKKKSVQRNIYNVCDKCWVDENN